MESNDKKKRRVARVQNKKGKHKRFKLVFFSLLFYLFICVLYVGEVQGPKIAPALTWRLGMQIDFQLSECPDP